MDSRLRSYEVRFSFINKEIALPGSVGRLRWSLPDGYLPPDLLVEREGLFGIFLQKEGRAQFFPIEDAKLGRPARLVDLPLDIKLIVEGRFGLEEGDILKVTE